MRNQLALPVLLACLAAVVPGAAWAQDGTQDLSGLDTDSLRGELQQRYDAGLAATLDPAIIRANDPRYIWASEAKVQCGIALGFLKSNTRDETSISKCQMAADMMRRVPAPPPRQAAAPPPPACPQQNPGMVFFEFDSSALPTDARQTVEFVARNAGPCNWRNFNVIGHADRSGSDAYNVGLSQRRAEAVAELLASMGVARASITTAARGEEQPRVPTADGVREPQNRRVEITVR